MTLRCRLRTSLHCDQTLRALTATDRESHLPSTCRVQARSHFFLATLPHAAPTGLNREASLCPRLLSVEWEYGSGPGAAVHCTSLPSPDLALRTAQEADEILTSLLKLKELGDMAKAIQGGQWQSQDWDPSLLHP